MNVTRYLSHYGYLSLALLIYGVSILWTGGVAFGWAWTPRLSSWTGGHPLYIRIGALGLILTALLLQLPVPELATKIVLITSIVIVAGSVLLQRWL